MKRSVMKNPKERNSHGKRRGAYLLMALLLLECTACGGDKGKAESTQPKEQSSVSKSGDEMEQTLPELLTESGTLEALLPDSAWGGVTESGGICMVEFQKNGCHLTIQEPGAEEISCDAAYTIDENGLKFSGLEESAAAIEHLKCEILVDGEDICLKWNDTYLTRQDLKDAKEQLEALDLAAKAKEYLSQGHCWIACAKDRAVILYFDGSILQLTYLEKQEGEIICTEVSGEWAFDAAQLKVFDENKVCLEDLTWNLEEEGDLKALTIDDGEEQYLYYETETSDTANGVELAKEYLQNQKEPEEVEAYTTILSGYQGVSIVDAFVAAGLNPAFENRAVFAEKFGIEDYRGTAKQNLTLLEKMGGKIS